MRQATPLRLKQLTPYTRMQRSFNCYRCGLPGHIAAKCTSKQNRNSGYSYQQKSGSVENSSNNNSKAPNQKDEQSSFPELVDIGANLTKSVFKRDINQILQRSVNNGVKTILITGTSIRESINAQKLAESLHGVNGCNVFCTAGVHPHDANTCNEETIPTLRDLATNHKSQVVALGECGLDFNRMFSEQKAQEHWFEKQLELAAELKMPLFLHERDAHESFLNILSKYRPYLGPVVVHCFTGKQEEVEQYIKLDCHIGFTGTICNKNRGAHLREILKSRIIPLNRLMLETDAPFMIPFNMPQKVDRNEPSFLPYVLKVMAESYGETEETIAQHTTQNAKEFFKLPL